VEHIKLQQQVVSSDFKSCKLSLIILT